MFCCFHSQNVITLLKINIIGQDSVVGIATCYGLDSVDRPWDQPSPKHNGYQICFPAVKWPASVVDHPPSYRAQDKGRVELYASPASWNSWQVIG
jgi:hypothetical protein